MQLRRFLLAAAVALTAFDQRTLAAHYIGFPSEEDFQREIHVGMTAEEVISLFGDAVNRNGASNDGNFVLFYRAPIASLREERYGYVGFEIYFVDGRVRGGRELRSYPSYHTERGVPQEVRTNLWLLGAMFGATLVYVGWLRNRRIKDTSGASTCLPLKGSSGRTASARVSVHHSQHNAG